MHMNKVLIVWIGRGKSIKIVKIIGFKNIFMNFVILMIILYCYHALLIATLGYGDARMESWKNCTLSKAMKNLFDRFNGSHSRMIEHWSAALKMVSLDFGKWKFIRIKWKKWKTISTNLLAVLSIKLNTVWWEISSQLATAMANKKKFKRRSWGKKKGS